MQSQHLLEGRLSCGRAKGRVQKAQSQYFRGETEAACTVAPDSSLPPTAVLVLELAGEPVQVSVW